MPTRASRADILGGEISMADHSIKSDVEACRFLTRVKVLTAGGFSCAPPHLPCKHKMLSVKMEGFRAAAMDSPQNWQTAVVRRGESSQFLDQEVTSGPEGGEAEPLSTKWTDEKHSSYLNSMEASFVNQLYNSSDLLGWPPRKWNPSVPRPSPISSGQLKVLRGGLWQKMKSARAENQLHSDIQSNPWIRHFRSSKRGRDSGLPFPREEDASISKAVRQKGKQAVSSGGPTTSRQSLYHQDSVGSNIEVSDQNFVEDKVEGDTKRMRTPSS